MYVAFVVNNLYVHRFTQFELKLDVRAKSSDKIQINTCVCRGDVRACVCAHMYVYIFTCSSTHQKGSYNLLSKTVCVFAHVCHVSDIGWSTYQLVMYVWLYIHK